MSKESEKTEETGEKEWFDRLVDAGKWRGDNPDHFKPEGKILYDEKNLKRIKRFADAPLGYIEERIELNKEVSKNYHKLHHSILLAGITGFYILILYQFVVSFIEVIPLINTPEMSIHNFGKPLSLLAVLIISPLIVRAVHFTYHVLEWTGLLKVIRDSEIEVYYLTRIKEHRKLLECSKCGEKTPKESKFCMHCGQEMTKRGSDNEP